MVSNRVAIITIICITAIFFFPIFSPGFYNSHDGEAHVARFAAYYKAYQDGQFPPRWAGDLNFQYGSPVFIFYYPMPGSVASFLHIFGISFENTYKILMFLSVIFSGVFFYMWSKSISRNVVSAFIASVMYVLLPYHFLNVYVRGDVAESLAYMFVPLVFFFIEKYFLTKKIIYITLGAVAYALLIFSHNAVSLMFSPVLFFYACMKVTTKKHFFSYCIMFLSGLCLSAFFWLPALIESKYVLASRFIGDMYKNNFPTFQQLVYSKWGFGSDVNVTGGLSPQVGIPAFFVVAASIFGFYKTKKNKFLVFWLSVFIVVTFLSLQSSIIVWEKMPLLRLFQFPWRLTGLLGFSACALSLFVLDCFENKKTSFIFFILIIGFSMPFVSIKNIPAKEDNFYMQYSGSTYYHGQATTIWTAGDAESFPKMPIEVIDGRTSIKNLQKKSQRHTFYVDGERATIMDNTVYFPGWKIFVDGQERQIEFQDMNHRGFITFVVPQGKHLVEVVFTESRVRFFSDMLSFIMFLVIFIQMGWYTINKLKK